MTRAWTPHHGHPDEHPSIGQAPVPADATASAGAGAGPPVVAGTPTSSQDAPVVAVGPVAVVVPLRLASLGNRREHWRARARRVRREMAAVLGALAGRTPPALPVVVEIERTGWNSLDPDGLVGAAKSGCIDGVSAWLGIDDRAMGLHLRLSQRLTRERRFVRDGNGRGRWETACAVRITIRAWQPSDGRDPLRVLAAPPRKVQP